MEGFGTLWWGCCLMFGAAPNEVWGLDARH